MSSAADPIRRPNQPIASVDNALRILSMFRDRDRVRIAEASKALGVAPSTASRVMAMLQYHGFVTQDPETRAYVAGPGIVDIAFGAMRRMHDHRHVRRHLEQLVRETTETVHYVVLSGAQAVFLDGVESQRPVKTTLRLGERRHAHCVSGGKTMLAALRREELHRVYPSPRLPRCTDRTIRTRADLEKELARVREQGYATSVQESEPDIAAVAMNVLDGRGDPTGAIAISMPMIRYTEATLEAVLPPLRRAVDVASAGATF
jgi:IclR family transcriptional regulator, acetate operon repressor